MDIPIDPQSVVAAPAQERGRGRYFVLAVLALIALLNTMDQSILSVTSPAIQTAFGLSDTQIGFLSAAFVVVYGFTAMPAGYWVDRARRGAIVGGGVALWSLCTLLTGLAQSFPQLFAARAALGVGEATSVPASVSLLGDHFTKTSRGRAASAIQGSLQLGLALGLVAGGLVAARLGWRAAFYLAAAPGLLLAALALVMPEPARGAGEPRSLQRAPHDRASGTPGRESFLRLMHTRTVVAAVMANLFVVLATTGIGGFIALYVSRRFGIDLGQVGVTVGGPLLAGGVLGNALGGWLLDARVRRSERAPLEIVTAATLCAALALLVAFQATSPGAFAVAFFVATLLGNLGMPGLLAVNQSLAIPSLRGRLTATQQLTSNVFGRAAGLLLIGVVSDALHDLQLALLIVPAAALVCAAIAAASGLATIARDVARMEAEWTR